VSDMGGLPEMADVVEGLVFPKGDGLALSEAVTQLWDDPDAARARGEAGRKGAVAHFDRARHMEALEKIYQEASEG
jgi:glycosyltransferase involved in cell wall biosynthesis